MIYTINGLMMTFHSIIPIILLTEYSHAKVDETTSISYSRSFCHAKIYSWLV
jgi:hypothetical protein